MTKVGFTLINIKGSGQWEVTTKTNTESTVCATDRSEDQTRLPEQELQIVFVST